MSYCRSCRDCPIPECGAKYLVKLSNHLADVHGLSVDERRKWLQESKLQPIVKVKQYDTNINSEQNDYSHPLSTRKRSGKKREYSQTLKNYSKKSTRRQREKPVKQTLKWLPLPY